MTTQGSLADRELRSKKTGTMDDKVISLIIKQVSDSVSANIAANMDEKFKSLDEQFSSFNAQITKNKSDIRKIDKKVDALEQYSRRCNLRFFGLENPLSHNLAEEVCKLINEKLKITHVGVKEIENCYRVNNKIVLVKFKSHDIKQTVFGAKTKLKNTQYVIREDLTNTRHHAVLAAVKKFGSKNVWTMDGKIRWKSNGQVVKPAFEQLEQIVLEMANNL